MATQPKPLNSDAFNEAAFVRHLDKKPLPSQPVPLKLGIYGGQGAGKTTTAALISSALSAQFYNRAPVFVVDPDMAWQFPKRRVFDVEGIELIQKPYRSFKQMRDSIFEAEKLGACCWIVDPLTLVWTELLDTFRGKKSFIPIDAWGQIRELWNAYIGLFMNSKMNCFALGRVGNDFEEQEEELTDGNGKKTGEIKNKLVKVGTKFKAGGGESFGYEPHFLIEMSLERKAKKVRGQERQGEGRMVHRADVLKDRTWMLNGHVLRWSDKSSYEKAGFAQVWTSLRPHWQEVQATMAQPAIIPGSSDGLLNHSGESEWYAARERKTAISAEIKAVLDLYFGGRAKEDIQMRITVSDAIFGVKSKEAADQLSIKALERGLRILQAFHKYPDKTDKNAVQKIAEAIHEYDSGTAELEELAF
jgi:hypothetical protein